MNIQSISSLIRRNQNKMALMLKQPSYNPKVFDILLAATKKLQAALAVLLTDNEEISDMEGERRFMMAESSHRQLTEDEHLIYNL